MYLQIYKKAPTKVLGFIQGHLGYQGKLTALSSQGHLGYPGKLTALSLGCRQESSTHC